MEGLNLKWFKHDSNANNDAKLKRVMLKYGMEGYGLYWFCLELIAQTVERHNLTFELEHDAELIAAATGIHFERVQELMADFVKLGLFQNSDGIIFCLKMAARTDEYTQKLLKNNPTSRQCPANIGIKSETIEEKEQNKQEQNKIKRDDIHFDRFYECYPRKQHNESARKAWNKNKLDPIIEQLIVDVENRKQNDHQWQSKEYIPLPATYLNKKLWNDEVIKKSAPKKNTDWEQFGRDNNIHARPGESMTEYIKRLQSVRV